MKQQFIVFVAICLVYLCQGSVIKNSLSMIMKSSGDFQNCGKEILQEINEFRKKNHYFPRIRWNDDLSKTVIMEAQEIAQKKSFGQHSNFNKWKKKVSNKYFTEIAVTFEGIDQNPPPNNIIAKVAFIQNNIFKKTVLHTILKDHEFYLIHQYTQGAVSVIRLNAKSKKYIAVIHLLRSGKRSKSQANNNAIQQKQKPKQQKPVQKKKKDYESCNDAIKNGDKSESIMIKQQGKEIKIQCDQTTAGGGWTKILDLNQNLFQRVVTPIDDQNLKFNEILFKAKPGYYFTSGKSLPNKYKYDGFLFQSNMFRFGDTWLVSQLNSPSYDFYRKKIPNLKLFDNKKQVKILKPSEKCIIEKENELDQCAKEFILKGPFPSGKLNAISQSEAVADLGWKDNQWTQNFNLYVR